MIRFRRKFGNVLPLRRPRTLNEKINWMKIFGEVELLTRCSDKVRVREYVEERLGADVCLPELYLVTENADDLTPSAIGRDRFVVKANHDSGSSILCKDSATFDYADARKKMSHYLKLSYSDFFMEPQYSGIVPKILVEEMIECSNGSPLGDYRMMCYGGRVEFFYVNVYEGGRKYRAYFDRDWRRFHVSQTSPDYPGIVEKPPFFDRLVSMSEQLAAPFDFVRVDWNIADDKLYFGELTFTPQAGFGRYDPPEMDLLLGEKLKLTRSRYRAVQWALARGLMG